MLNYTTDGSGIDHREYNCVRSRPSGLIEKSGNFGFFFLTR